MRTTLELDDDVLRLVKPMARARDSSIGRIVSEMVRKGLYSSRSTEGDKTRDGFPVFKVGAGAHPITLADVQRAEDEP